MSYLDNIGLSYFWSKIKAAIPTKISQLTNDTAFITTSSNITGNAATATKATQDASGNIITSTYAKLASPALTGVPTAPTAVSGTNTTQLATTAFVSSAIAGLVNSAPAALNTLNELSAALNNDPNFATTIVNTYATKTELASCVKTVNNVAPDALGNITITLDAMQSAGFTCKKYMTLVTWTANASTITVTNANIKADSLVVMGSPTSVTSTELDVLARAKITCTNQIEGSLTLTALGTAPTSSVSIQLTII